MGYCYSATCGPTCNITKVVLPCSTTQPPTTSTASPTTSVASTTVTPTSTSATTVLFCEYLGERKENGETWNIDNCTTATCTNGQIVQDPVTCETVQPPICSNFALPFQVADDSGCCYRYICPCECSSWKKTSFLTFDGKQFDFNQNCSYYAVLLNDKRIHPTYENEGLLITGTNLVIELEIPALETYISYGGSNGGSYFHIDLPPTLFSGATEGLCGTCDNSITNDCRGPNGQIEECTDSANKWRVDDIPCVPTTPPPTVPNPSPTPCLPHPACDILSSSVFSACHLHVSPTPYLTTCQTDLCSGDKNTCVTLAAYASECSMAGVCVHWRNATNGECDCVGPDGKPKQPNDIWTSECNNCRCDSDSMSVQCSPVVCTPYPSPDCSLPGFKTVYQTVDCCMSEKCECNISLCPAVKICSAGYTTNVTTTYGDCCTTHTCVPKDVCVNGNVEYTIGSQVPSSDICEDCSCSNDGTETIDAQGCCTTCQLRSSCEMVNETTIIEIDGCKSPAPIQLAYCSGTCGSTSK
ncbi:hypothetical protein NHX12_005482 [Muraenolepis orangiensis]|uniref:VWFD domain-containing protein n=1 Tax=Muraenolepis orangiensis TaxID=630683 RepID=A0A9Q0DT05_9TELE|nr:hypothetical protein NHX12_005482 [Muraenolepis orangiensis]